jgi:hypothetical protein
LGFAAQSAGNFTLSKQTTTADSVSGYGNAVTGVF